MIESLSYRIPGQGVKSKQGSFMLLDSISAFEGFVVSNFKGTQLYGFIEDDRSDLENSQSSGLAKNKRIPLVISKENYLKDSQAFLSKLIENKIDKAIYSRVKKCRFEGDSINLFQSLLKKYPKAFCYLIQSELLGNWAGASPENLIELNNNQGNTVALASTKRFDDSSSWGEKELSEQELVSDFIESTLEKNTISVKKSKRTELIAGPVKHLITRFSFECQMENLSQLLKDLHPTPAVSGFPREKALDLIQESENHSREIYAGMIGLISKNSVQLFVNLRCCKIVDDSAYLFLGGGFTKDSIPRDEWNETENKALTILSVMQNI